MKTTYCALLVFVSAWLSGPINAEIISPTYDTYTVAGGGQLNGALAEFWAGKRPSCGHDENAMMYFDLDGYMGLTVESAVLHLNRFFGCATNVSNTDFFQAAEIWDESYGGSHIEHGSQVWANIIFNSNGWWEVDITELVQVWLSGTVENFGLVMECRTGSGTSKFHSKDAANESVRPYLEIQFTSEPTPSPSPTPESTPEPSPTPDEFEPSPTPGLEHAYVEIQMPSHFYQPGDKCSCRAIIQNNDDVTISNCPMCVVLAVADYYFFAPEFDTAFSCYEMSFNPGESTVEVIPEFNWPDTAGSADNIQWIAAFLNPEMTELYSNLSTFSFGWGD